MVAKIVKLGALTAALLAAGAAYAEAPFDFMNNRPEGYDRPVATDPGAAPPRQGYRRHRGTEAPPPGENPSDLTPPPTGGGY